MFKRRQSLKFVALSLAGKSISDEVHGYIQRNDQVRAGNSKSDLAVRIRVQALKETQSLSTSAGNLTAITGCLFIIHACVPRKCVLHLSLRCSRSHRCVAVQIRAERQSGFAQSPA